MRKWSDYEVTVNVTAHKEGYFLYRTLRAINAMCDVAAKDGILTFIQIHLDNTDTLTESIAQEFADNNKHSAVFKNNFSDPSASRNFLIDNTNTKYALFVDGDDLFTENFLKVAYSTAEDYAQPCIVSAEDIVKFDKTVDLHIFREESTVDKPGIKSALFEMNLFISQNFVSTEILKSCKYEPNKGNYGFEDWHWNTEVVRRGYEFLVAKDTVFFYRQKPDHQSVLRKNVNANTVIRPSSLFDPVVFANLPHDVYTPPVGSEEAIMSENQFKVVARTVLGRVMSYDSLIFRVLRAAYRMARHAYKDRGATLRSVTTNIGTAEEEYERPYEMTLDKQVLWRRMNAIEPVIRLDELALHHLRQVRYAHRHSLATTYYEFCKKYGKEGFTDIIFVPWINAGGADLAMLDLARELVKNGGRVLILTTTGIESQWAEKAKAIPGVTFLQSHDPIFRNLDHINIKLFFLRLVQNWKISSMTVMNSAIGFELIERFSHAIKDAGCRIVAHNYAFPVLDDQIVDAFPSLSVSYEKIDTIVVDSQVHRKEIHDLYGVSLDKIIEVPLMIADNLQKKTSGPTKRVLFANRIAREKQPQVAVRTFGLLQEMGISLDVYGARDEAFCMEVGFDELIEGTGNVEYKGLFASSQALNFNDYDICFMPSLYEGTPRIVLESAKAGLYVVCSNVGGMPEVVTSRYSGVVLPVEATPEDYAKVIKEYYADCELQDVTKRQKANSATMKIHSDKYYEQCVKSIYRPQATESKNV